MSVSLFVNIDPMRRPVQFIEFTKLGIYGSSHRMMDDNSVEAADVI
ncbi:hypothetical protein [Paenibacillus sp. RC67]|nr:hypothetical protein [Paenibacillus sp. RC67]